MEYVRKYSIMKGRMTVKTNQREGFVMVEVLVTVMFVMTFASLLFSSAARRYHSALKSASGTEARLAAEAVVQIFAENMLRREPAGILEKLQEPEGLSETEAVVWTEDGNGEEKKIETIVSSYWKADGSGLVLHAVCSVNGQKEGASRLIPMGHMLVHTPSSAERIREEKP